MVIIVHGEFHVQGQRAEVQPMYGMTKIEWLWRFTQALCTVSAGMVHSQIS